MKNANLSIALKASTKVWTGPSILVTSLGVVVNWQLGVSSRSDWNSSLVIPISTPNCAPRRVRSGAFFSDAASSSLGVNGCSSPSGSLSQKGS